MTHRVHPFIFRLGETTTWRSRWFNRKNYQEYLREDTLLREWLEKLLRSAHVSVIEIERSPNILNIILKTSRPGILLGRGGEGITKLKKDIEKRIIKLWKRRPLAKAKLGKREIKVTVEEIKSPETDASIVAQMMVEDIEKRFPFRRILKQTIEKVMSHKEAKGVKLSLSGRLDGSEMARYEWLKKGRVPLQTLRADIDYAQKNAYTTYGVIGVKVWIYKGDIFKKKGEEIKTNQ
ncbi:MAG: 30S ribosomal protein S3 [bacterium]|nr:30S ribosomal protein S3 [bacterium]